MPGAKGYRLWMHRLFCLIVEVGLSRETTENQGNLEIIGDQESFSRFFRSFGSLLNAFYLLVNLFAILQAVEFLFETRDTIFSRIKEEFDFCNFHLTCSFVKKIFTPPNVSVCNK